MSIISRLLRKKGAPFGFWLGPRFVIYFADPNDAETIINHPCSMDKGGVYKFIADVIGGPGLFSAGGIYTLMGYCERLNCFEMQFENVSTSDQKVS